LTQELEGFISVQGRRTGGQHGDRPTAVLDELGDRQVGHGRSLGEQVFGGG
jgi:hypothetical protein